MTTYDKKGEGEGGQIDRGKKKESSSSGGDGRGGGKWIVVAVVVVLVVAVVVVVAAAVVVVVVIVVVVAVVPFPTCLMGEMVQNLQQLLLLREEKTIKGLLIRQLVPFYP